MCITQKTTQRTKQKKKQEKIIMWTAYHKLRLSENYTSL